MVGAQIVERWARVDSMGLLCRLGAIPKQSDGASNPS